MKKIIVILMGALFVFSCSDVKELSDSVTKIKNDQGLILKKLNSIEKKLNKLPPSKADNKKDKPKADPNQVYDIADAGSIMLGNPMAAISIVKWTDFQ